MDSFLPLPPLPDNRTIRFSVSVANKCPFYTAEQIFDVDGLGLHGPETAPLCLILANDFFVNLLQKPHATPDNPHAFSCGGCGGSITIQGRPLVNIFNTLDTDQKRRVEALIETMGRFSLFKTLSEKDLRAVLPEMSAGNFEAGAIIVRQGEPGQSLYIVESGSVDVLAGAHDEILLTTLGKGELFGEMSLLSNTLCSATIRVHEPSRLLAIDGRVFTRLVMRYPSLQQYLFRLLTHRLRETNALKDVQLAKGIKGNLDDLALTELLQALHLSRKTGELALSLAQGEATIGFNNGQVCSASLGEDVGIEAFYRLLTQTTGSFSFSPNENYATKESLGEFMHLLMEGFVQLDEQLH